METFGFPILSLPGAYTPHAGPGTSLCGEAGPGLTEGEASAGVRASRGFGEPREPSGGRNLCARVVAGGRRPEPLCSRRPGRAEACKDGPVLQRPGGAVVAGC